MGVVIKVEWQVDKVFQKCERNRGRLLERMKLLLCWLKGFKGDLELRRSESEGYP